MVTDQGKGYKQFEKEKLKQLFDCQSLDREELETNSISFRILVSKLIVNKNGGEMGLISKYKKGSTFFFTFDIADEPFDLLLNKRKIIRGRLNI